MSAIISKQTTYRRDIDGLRAIAVIPVVLFHAGFTVFSGGYVGVDIFFVISGYLITSIIQREIAENRFSILTFYERRARRILPALMVVLFATLVAGWFSFLPLEFEAFGRSLIATVFFVANILFWQESGYFDADAETKPLLHTWSLSVEEQFYILFPVLLLFLHRYMRQSTVVWVAVASLLSLAVATWGVAHYPNAAFYLLSSRAWELGLGALLALGALPQVRRLRQANMLGMVGFGFILFSVFFYEPTTPFPGIAALMPCLGAVLVIHSGAHADTLIARLLSLAPLVWIGLISYSLYLWHWPILVFQRHLSAAPPGTLETLAMIALITLLAAASWKFVETPFRRRTPVLTRPRILVGAVVTMCLAALAGSVIVYQKGIYFRVPAVALDLALTASDKPRFEECQRLTGDDVRAGKLCVIGSQGAVPTFLVWGDSHAYALMPLLFDMANQYGVSGLYAPQGACAPLLGAKRDDPVGSPHCLDFNQAVVEVLKATPSIKTTLLVARWAENFEPYRFKAWAPPLVLRDTLQPSSDDDNRSVFERAITRTLATLNDLDQAVTIVTQVPDLKFNAPRYLATRAMFGNELTDSVEQALYIERQQGVSTLFERLQSRYPFSLIHPENWLCREGRCALFDKQVLLYRDDTHLSVRGSEIVRPAFTRFFSEQAGMRLSELKGAD